ncbi:titin-like protein [Lates japonicus]|uniref:Titin-like protein n=1 Tax=Lates japonicus TaxID=270547 RepID=A0AAD3MKC9_LATJO|nr:titin-like protein [Lates japonicus]
MAQKAEPVKTGLNRPEETTKAPVPEPQKVGPVVSILKRPEGTTKAPVPEPRRVGPVVSFLKRPEGTTKVPVPEPQKVGPVVSILKRPESTIEIRPSTPTAEPAITKPEIHQVMAQEYKIASLEREKLALIMEVERSKSQLSRVARDASEEMRELLAELYSNGKKGKDAERNAEKLRVALRMETNSRKEAEKNLPRQEEETSTIKQTLAQVKNDLENSRCQWENERSRLLADQRAGEGKINVGEGKVTTPGGAERETQPQQLLVKAQEDLDKEQLQWRQEKSGLLESLSVLKQALRDREQDRETLQNDLDE